MAQAGNGAKVALITGGSRGIGAEIARSLVSIGFEVAITGRNKQTLDETAARLGAIAIIVNIGSYAAFWPMPGNSAYATSKTALARLTDSVALEVEAAGVTVLCVSPGLVDTDMTRGLPMFHGLPADAWSPVEAIGELVGTIASHPGIHQLTGRFLHVQDDLNQVLTEGWSTPPLASEVVPQM